MTSCNCGLWRSCFDFFVGLFVVLLVKALCISGLYCFYVFEFVVGVLLSDLAVWPIV